MNTFFSNIEQLTCLRFCRKVGYWYTGLSQSTTTNKGRLLDQFPLSLDAAWNPQDPTHNYLITDFCVIVKLALF